MTSTTTPRLAACVGALVVAAVLSGCAPTPSATPTPSPLFDSEEEAFAAAEQTYRAYNDALNHVNPAVPETFEATYAFTSGDFEASDRESFSKMHADRHTIRGDAVVRAFIGTATDNLRETIIATICIDVSSVDVFAADGTSVVNPERPDVYALEATFKAQGNRVLIERGARTEEERCTAS